MPDAPGEKRSGTIQSVSIAARFLKTLANAEGELALGEVARRTGTGGSTAHRYLQSLVKEGLARQDPLSGLYDLGPAALSIGIGALKRIDAVDIAARHMKALAQRHAASGGVAIWTERGPTLVRWYRSAYFSINPLALGDILPIDNTACGLVFQAFLPKAVVDAARKQQPAHFRGSPPSRALLDEVRERCWAE
ncbi:IclR family transcriptional regulator, partial [Pseudomonas aeruginosa]|nr:IclR family transcriptional regulator [Pseudomonas aeruginosa]